MYVHRVASAIVPSFFNDVVFDTLVGSVFQVDTVVNATMPERQGLKPCAVNHTFVRGPRQEVTLTPAWINYLRYDIVGQGGNKSVRTK